MDTHLRTLVKSVTWRFIALAATVGMVYYYSRDWPLALSAGLAANILKTLFYYLHERVWNKIKWGTHKNFSRSK